jgi:hypothetical protein
MSEQDLTALYVKSQSYCLNFDPAHPMSNLYVSDDALFLKSDTDEQLLIHIVFQTAARLSSIALRSSLDGSTPTSVRLFANLISPGFTDINELEPTQVITVGDTELSTGRKIILKQVKFQRCDSLTIFIAENRGEDFTTLSGLKIFGFTLDSLDVGSIHHQHSHSHDS